MAKKKKTRQQKIIADLRRQVNASQSHVEIQKREEKKENPISISLSNKVAIIGKPQIFTNTYPYLVNDLRKTAILSLAIIFAQLIFLFVLRNHLITIGGLIY